MWALIDRMDGCLTEWATLNRRFEAISAAIGWLLAVFLGGTLLATQVSRLGVVGKHCVLPSFADGELNASPKGQVECTMARAL